MVIERILLNIFFVILPLILLPIICGNSYERFTKIRSQYLIISTMLMTFACMSFAIPVDDSFIFDFRFIPFLLASLYVGPKASIILFLFTMLYRVFLGGNIGIVLAGQISLMHVVLSFLYSKRFILSSSRKQMVIFTFVQSASWGYAFLYMNIMHGVSLDKNHLILFIAQILASMLVIYLGEYITTNLILHNKVMKSEKMDIVSHLAASISHEVRNPLTTVRGFLQLLSQTIDSPKPKDYIKISIKELDRAEAIIRDYLTFAKPSPNNIELLDIKKELTGLVEITRPLANQYNVEIHTDFRDGLVFHGDSQALKQCFINMMKNSLEAMSSGGELKIEAYQDGKQIKIRLTDNGVGMTKEQLARLGEPYFTTKGNKGTGLGMMVVFRIIETMRGNIDIKSTLGSGTKIIVTLPLAKYPIENNEAAVSKEKKTK